MNLVKTSVITQQFGWSRGTIERMVRAGKFPKYKISRRDVKYDLDEVTYFVMSTRVGNFEHKGAA